MLVQVSYTFIFNPTETWQHQSQLDGDIAKFLRDRGLIAEQIQTQVVEPNQSPVERKLVIHKLPPEEKPVEEKKPKSVQEVKNELMKKRNFKGKVIKPNTPNY